MTLAGREAPRFSVVVPAYNAASTLTETLDAVLAQSFSDWECIVVDDGSTDRTPEIATAFARRDPRIRVVQQGNQGTAGAYNNGVSKATGDFIVICSADDILLPEHLSSMSAFIDTQAGYDIYSSNGHFWWPDDSQELFYGPGDEETMQSFELADVICSFELPDVIRRCFYSVGATYRRHLFAEVGGYRPGVYGEDYDFWLRAMALGARHRYLPEPLSLFRVSSSQKSADPETVFRSDIRLVSDLRRDFHLSAAEDAAVAERLHELEFLIVRSRHPMWRARLAVRQFAYGVLGRRRARRLWRVVKSTVGLSRSPSGPGS